MAEKRIVSIDADDFVASALYPGGLNLITNARFVLWDYGGTQPPDSNCALALDCDPKDGSNEGKPHTEYWNVGASKDYIPSEDGAFLFAEHEPNQASNFFQLMKSFRDSCGLEKGRLSTPVGVKALIGSELHFIRVDAPTREFKDTGLDPSTGMARAQNQQKKQILVASKARWAWEGNKARPATPATQKPQGTGTGTGPAPATNMAPATQTAVAASTTGTTTNGDGDPLVSSIIAILTENEGAIELSALMPKITEKLSVVAGLTAGRRITMLKKVKNSDGSAVDPEKLTGLSDKWTVDTGEGLVILT